MANEMPNSHKMLAVTVIVATLLIGAAVYASTFLAGTTIQTPTSAASAITAVVIPTSNASVRTHRWG